MKILSRPEEQPVGIGDYVIRMSFEEMQFIAALVYITRLGTGSPYREAAFNLLNVVEEVFGEDFPEDSATDIDLYVSKVSEADGDTIEEQWHYSEIALEV